jgi:hypothetical protein
MSKILETAVVSALTLLATSVIVMLLWNFYMVSRFALPELSYTDSLFICCIGSLVAKS